MTGNHLDYEQKKSIAIWSVRYLLENQDITWEEYENSFLKSPCELVKKTTSDPKYQAYLPVLLGKTDLDNEVGYKLSHPVPNTGQTGTQDQILENYPGTRQLNMIGTNYTFAFMHSHYNGLYPIFSPDDLLVLNNWVQGTIAYNNNPANSPKVNIKELSITVVSDYGTYLMYFDGTTLAPFPNYTKKEWDDLLDEYKEAMNKSGNPSNADYMKKMEKEFLKFVDKYMPMPGLKLFKVESGGNKEIFLTNGSRDFNQCP